MFQFGGFPSYTYLIQYTIYDSSSYVFPHSEICGSKLICSSPQLIAACHVLHRLLMPRHSLCALVRLNFCRYPFLDILFSLCLNCCVSRFIQLLFSLSKIVCNFTQLWKDLIFHHIFSLCLLSLFVYLILASYSVFNDRSQVWACLSSIFIELSRYSIA